MPYFDDISRAWVVEGYAEAGGFVFGRRTYENLASYWPNASEEEQVIAVPLNTKPKFVASTTLTGPLDWEHSTLLDRGLREQALAAASTIGSIKGGARLPLRVKDSQMTTTGAILATYTRAEE